MALLAPHFLDCVVALGVDDVHGNRQWVGSGFFYGVLVAEIEDDPPKKGYAVYLVTNRHVFEAVERVPSDSVFVRANPPGNLPAHDYPLMLNQNGARLWTPHPDPDIDVAVIRVNFNQFQTDEMQVGYFTSDGHAVRTGAMTAVGMSEGDSLFVLGFPMGMVGTHRSVVLVRGGTLARVRDLIAGTEKTFLVDASVFPGNSGGPVVSKPEIASVAGTKAVGSSYLIGIVRAYRTYTDVAVSQQTQRPRITFEENAALAEAHPVDHIEQAIQAVQGHGALETDIPLEEVEAEASGTETS